MAGHITDRLAEAGTVGEFVELLDELRQQAGLSYRDFPRKARALGRRMAATTVFDMLTKAILPNPERLETYLLICGVSPAEVNRWQEARAQVVRGQRSSVPERRAWPRPHQLPLDVAEFVGRRADLRQLDTLVRTERARVVLISGPPGVGKTALTVHWAHQQARRFPDGQLFLNLNGYSASGQLPPLRALHRLLLDMGIRLDGLPSDVEQSAALLRSIIAGKRMLLVFDNVARPDQVRDLLPGDPQSLALLTSRNRLSGLVASIGARHVPVSPMSTDDATRLIGLVSGRHWTHGEAEALHSVATICGGMPLALRIAAAKLVSSSHLSITDYARRLTEHGVIRQLRIPGDEESAVATALDYSYAALPELQQQLLQTLAYLPGRGISPEPAAAAAKLSPADTLEALDALAEENLVAADGGRYFLHDLLRAYLREMTSIDEQRAAIDRAYAWYLARAHAMADIVMPQAVRLPSTVDPCPPFATTGDAVNWFERYQHDMEEAVIAAADLGLAHRSWELTDALRAPLMMWRGSVDWLAMSRAALTAAEDDAQAQAACHLAIGIARELRGEIRRALTHYRQAAEQSAAAGWQEGLGSAYNKLGVVSVRIGLLAEAAEYMQLAIELARANGRRGSEAGNLSNLGSLRIHRGEFAQALSVLTEAVQLHQEAGTRRGEVSARINRGFTNYLLGHSEKAVQDLLHAAWIQQELSDRHPDFALALSVLAEVNLAMGDITTALLLGQSALYQARTGDSPHGMAPAARITATARLTLGQRTHAKRLYRIALGSADLIRLRHEQIGAMAGLARAELADDRPRAAVSLAREAVARAEEFGFPIYQARAQLILGYALSDLDDPEATQQIEEALRVLGETAYRPDLLRALADGAPLPMLI